MGNMADNSLLLIATLLFSSTFAYDNADIDIIIIAMIFLVKLICH